MSPGGFDSSMYLVDSLLEALKLVSEGKYDYTIAPYSLGLNTIRENDYRNVKAEGRPVPFFEYRFAVQKGKEDLLFFLNYAIAGLKSAANTIKYIAGGILIVSISELIGFRSSCRFFLRPARFCCV